MALKKLGESKASTLLFAGCSADRDSGRGGAIALARLMRQAGEDFVILGDAEKCCGLYAFDLGFRREYERLKDDNLATLKNAGIKKVVVACGSCQRIWREYLKDAGAEFQVIHGVEYIDQLVRVGAAKFRPSRSTRKLLTTTPVIFGRGCGVYAAPRNILRAIPGVQLVEMERNQRWAWCCGGGGGVPEADPELAEWSAADRMREAEATGAELMLTSSALCQRSFGDLSATALPIQDLLEFALQAL